MKYQRLEVKWVDAAHYQGWGNKEEMSSAIPKECFSVGYRLKGGKDFIRLAQSVSGIGSNDEQIGDVLVIPKVWVKGVKVL